MSDEQDIAAKRVAISSALFVAYFAVGVIVAIVLANWGLSQSGWTLGMALYATVVAVSWMVAKRSRFGKYLWDIRTFWV